jgi:hypothetical protein
MKMASGTADFSPCMRYRYALTRSWDATRPELLVVMLNPSTADALHDDPTIRRVRGFAERWAFGSVRIMNLFALQSTDPRALMQHEDPVGPENDERLRAALAETAQPAPSGRWVLAAWGVHGNYKARAFRVLHMVPGAHWFSLGTTQDGSPRHPLYIASSTKPREFMLTPSGGDA